MMFLAPWAAAGAILLAGPLLVHMLLRRQARHLLFPATRFLTPTRAAAVRVRRPSDLPLLLVRLAIVGAAVVAVMQPIVLTARRLASWDTRIARAVVVDTSASVPQGPETARLAEQELSAFRVQRFDGADMRDALARAAAWLAGAPPARREVVILSDFQRGALDRPDLDVLPPGTGIRTIRVGKPQPRAVRATPPVAFQGAAWQLSTQLDESSTAVTWTKSGTPAPFAWLTTSQAANDNDAASRAVGAAAAAGVPAGDDAHRVRIRFAGAPADGGQRAQVRTPWMVAATLALQQSALLRQTQGAVATAEQNGQLIVDTPVAASAIDAPAIVRAVVLAVRPVSIADRETEVVSASDAELAAWRRDAAPLSTTSVELRQGADPDSDARWFWAIALALLGVETWLRRRTSPAMTQQVRDAA